MNFKIKKQDIIDTLSKVQGLTGRKSNLAITANILISTTDSGITIVVTDLETGFEGQYPAKVESHGTIVINSRKFYEIVKEFPSDDIQVNEIENHWIKIGNKTVEYNIVGMNPEDFARAAQEAAKQQGTGGATYDEDPKKKKKRRKKSRLLRKRKKRGEKSKEKRLRGEEKAKRNSSKSGSRWKNRSPDPSCGW